MNDETLQVLMRIEELLTDIKNRFALMNPDFDDAVDETACVNLDAILHAIYSIKRK